jgi:lysophospholipase L1-like esterase
MDTKLNYFKLIFILIVPMILIVLYSFAEKDLRAGSFVLQKADIADYFQNPLIAMSSVINTVSDVSIADTIPEQKDSIVYDTLPQRIFFFGDSMLEGLSRRMMQYAAENGHELLNLVWVSSSTKIYAENIDTLLHFMQKFQPTYIFICLGGNELFVKDLKKRDSYIKTIIQAIDTIPYVWIGPPNWKNDTGINDLIESNVGNRFFLSKNLTFKRIEDGMHPTYASAAVWLDSVARWMRDSVQYRIAMERPKSTSRYGETIRLKPLE